MFHKSREREAPLNIPFRRESSLLFPTLIDYLHEPACYYAEKKWLQYILENLGDLYKLGERFTVASPERPKHWQTFGLHKEPAWGETTYLCLTGSLAGFIAADLQSRRHQRYLKRNYDIRPPYPDCCAMAIRPLLVNSPAFNTTQPHLTDWIGIRYLLRTHPDGDRLEGLLREKPDNWYPRVLLFMLKAAGVRVDKKRFIKNVNDFWELLKGKGLL